MRVRWLGQSAFHVTSGSTSVLIDPFADFAAAMATHGRRFDYPVERDLPAGPPGNGRIFVLPEWKASRRHLRVTAGGEMRFENA